MKILRSRLLEQAEQAQNDSIAADRRRQVGSGRPQRAHPHL